MKKQRNVQELFPGWEIDGLDIVTEKDSASGIFPWEDFNYNGVTTPSVKPTDETLLNPLKDWTFDRDPIAENTAEMFPWAKHVYSEAKAVVKPSEKNMANIWTQEPSKEVSATKNMSELWNEFEKPESLSSFGISKYGNTYTSFSGADMVASIVPKGGKAVMVGELQTVSYSVYTPTTPVYVLGDKKPAGFVKGPRTIAGSLIFTVFDRHVLISLMQESYKDTDKKDCILPYLVSDELPAFDLHISCLNEYGQSATLVLYDLRILSEGQTMSIEDMITENTMQYLASDIQLMQPDTYENENYGYARYKPKDA